MEINDLGISVPEELSVIGFDNIDFAKAAVPRLSIVTQPTKEIAREAAAVLLQRLDERSGKTLSVPSAHPLDSSSGNSHNVKIIKLKTKFMEGRSIKKLEDPAAESGEK